MEVLVLAGVLGASLLVVGWVLAWALIGTGRLLLLLRWPFLSPERKIQILVQQAEEARAERLHLMTQERYSYGQFLLELKRKEERLERRADHAERRADALRRRPLADRQVLRGDVTGGSGPPQPSGKDRAYVCSSQ